jgi:hypothetical protein
MRIGGLILNSTKFFPLFESADVLALPNSSHFIGKEKENMLFHWMAKGTLQIIKKSYNDSQRIFMVENQ